MARIQTGTQIEDKSVPRAVTAKGYLGRAILVSNIWESTCMSFVEKVGYFVDDDANEHIKRNLSPNSYVFTPVVRLCTSPTGDVVSPQCKVEYLRLSPNKYNQLCDAIRRNPTFTHLELVVDSTGQFETTVAVPVSTPIPFVPEIQKFISTLDVETLLTTIKNEMGSPLSILDARLAAKAQYQQVAAPGAAQGAQGATQTGAQGSFQAPTSFPAFAQPQQAQAVQQPFTPPAQPVQPQQPFAQPQQPFAQPQQQFTPPAFQPQQQSQPAFQAFQPQQQAQTNAQPQQQQAQPDTAPTAQPGTFTPPTQAAAPQAGTFTPPTQAAPQGGAPQGAFQFPQFQGFVDGK
jgi:hypothetical protein